MSKQHIVAETVIANSIIAAGPAGRVTSSDIFSDRLEVTDIYSANSITANTLSARNLIEGSNLIVSNIVTTVVNTSSITSILMNGRDLTVSNTMTANSAVANVFTANTVVFRDSTSQNTAFGFCGSFERSSNQYSAGITSSNVVSFDITSTSKGVIINSQSSTQITFSNPGLYFMQFDGQFYHDGGKNTVRISTWYTKNGGNSGLSYTYSDDVANGSPKQILGTVSDIITVSTPGDYVQFYWWSDDVDVIMIATPAGSNPTRPYSPSAKVNVYKVG